MSGIKPIDLTRFYRKLHANGSTVEKLAEKLYSNRAHLTQVLNGTRPGGQTWRKLARVLTTDELALLGRDEHGKKLPSPAAVPRETLSQVEHSAQPVEAA